MNNNTIAVICHKFSDWLDFIGSKNTIKCNNNYATTVDGIQYMKVMYPEHLEGVELSSYTLAHPGWGTTNERQQEINLLENIAKTRIRTNVASV